MKLQLNQLKKKLSIEIIGDSITAAYGVEGLNQYENFKTTTENFSKYYAYLTVKNKMQIKVMYAIVVMELFQVIQLEKKILKLYYLQNILKLVKILIIQENGISKIINMILLLLI